jgi:putative ribosome biogenesis GTPase RsgA
VIAGSNDCTHLGEPGCALEAVAQRGAIDERRLSVYRRSLRNWRAKLQH